jgi:Na+-driven multidrug efflux pump
MLGIKPFAAVTIISPVFFLLYAMGFMFGEGASALVSQYMGEGNRKRGCEIFSMTTVVMVIFGTVVAIAAALLMPQFAYLVGADESNIEYCVTYGRMLVVFLPAYLVNAAYMSLWITAEKAWLGMVDAALNGLINVVLDAYFMGPLNMGVGGAALASSIAALIAAIIPIIYFFLPNKSSLRYTRFALKDIRELIQICTNGASNMVDSVAGNLTHLLMNRQLIKYVGELGVAAAGVYDYVNELFIAVLYGIASTAVTVVGYKYGEKKRDELNGLVKNNTVLSLMLGVILYVVFYVCAGPIAKLYIGYDPASYALAVKVMRIMGLSSLVIGFNLFVSSFFTGLGNGLVSAAISMCGSLLAPMAAIIVIPVLFGGDAIWFSMPVAVLFTAFVSAIMLQTQYYRKKIFVEPN